METKLFELRDRGTFIPLLCIKPGAEALHKTGCDDSPCTCGAAFIAKMAWRYGYKDNPAIIVVHMGNPDRGAHSDPYAWSDRTFQTAHQWIKRHWDEIQSGHVVDVEFILGETLEPKASEA
jgi:hypothetical protein